MKEAFEAEDNLVCNLRRGWKYELIKRLASFDS